METIGYIALSMFGLVGFAITLYAVVEFFTIQFSMFKLKVATELDVKKEHVTKQAELRKKRLERKREADDIIANKKLEAKIKTMNEKTDEKLGITKQEELPKQEENKKVHEVEVKE